MFINLWRQYFNFKLQPILTDCQLDSKIQSRSAESLKNLLVQVQFCKQPLTLSSITSITGAVLEATNKQPQDKASSIDQDKTNGRVK